MASHKVLIHNAEILNEQKRVPGSVLIENGRITGIYRSAVPGEVYTNAEIIDATGMYLMPGAIDDQVHFREPGLTHKGDIFTESRAAAAGGITSFMEMPNTKPQTTTIEAWEEKNKLGSEKSVVNYAFYLGATNDNIEEIRKADPTRTCGLKIFMGSSTGNMLVDNRETLEKIFSETKLLVAVHCEDEATIRENTEKAKAKFGEEVPIEMHPVIRNAEACYLSSSLAVSLARKYNTRLHVLHLSSAKEMSLFSNAAFISNKLITGEVCIHHLWFSDEDYANYGSNIKWNPSVKSAADRDALWIALKEDRLDIIATDHAPHLPREKEGGALNAASGGPMVQHAVMAMFTKAAQGFISPEAVVQKMCHAPATVYRIKERGFVREGYFADLVLVNPNKPYTVSQENILYKCGWSPFEGTTFSASVEKTWVNGELVFDNGVVDDSYRGQALTFEV